MINIYRNCPFCTFQFNDKLVPIYRSYYQKIISSYVKCNQCKIVYVDPIPNQSILKEIYDENNYHNECYKIDDYESYKISYKKTLFHISKFLKKNSKFLDYGCGNGFFLKYLNDNKYDVEGAEFDLKASKSASIISKSKVYLIHEFVNSDKFYDFIYLGDVFEHIGLPRIDIPKIINKIKSGGYICIEGPVERNFSLTNLMIILNSLLKNKIKKKHLINQKPYHLSFFNNNQIYNFFNEFNDLEFVESVVYETGWPLLGSSFFKNILGLTSIFLSKIIILNKFYGNRNRIIFKKK